MSIETLRQALAAATWPVVLNAAYLDANGVTAPDGFDALLGGAFALGGAAGLSVGQGTVGPVTGGTSFAVTGATLTGGLYGAGAADTAVTLTFTLPAAEAAGLLVRIDTALNGGWTFAKGFPAMLGNPFSNLAFGQAAMLFSTAAGSAVWPPSGGSTVALGPGMTFAGALALNPYQASVLTIAGIAGAQIPDPLVMSGPFDASAASDTVPYPVMALRAPLLAESFSFLGYAAAAPFLGFSIGPMPAADEDGASADDAPAEQPVASFFGATLTTATDPALDLLFQVSLPSGGSSYSMLLGPQPDASVPLTPATVAAIAGVPQTFMAAMPAPLQGFFTSVAFQGLNLTAMLPAGQSIPTVSAIGIAVGTADDFSYVLVDDPSGQFTITITSFDLSWTVLSPTAKPQQRLLIASTFTLLPQVFKGVGGRQDGEFRLTIDQDFTIAAAFDGEVSMADLLPAVTGGAVRMPSGLAVSFSDVQLLIDTGARTYSFSFVVDLAVDIITWNGQPLIQLQGMTLALGAATPQDPRAATAYSAALKGLMVVGPVSLNVDIAYQGGGTAQWRLATSLARPLALGDLVQQLYAVTDASAFLPDFLPRDLVVETFGITATIPTGSGASSYRVSAALDWTTTVLPGLPIACTADLALAYDGSRAPGQAFSGAVLGTIDVPSVPGLVLTIGYAFNQPGQSGDGSVLTVQWNGITGTYDSAAQSVTLTLKGWSLGSLVTELVALTGNPYFTLDGPWAVLNAISLDGLSLAFHMASGAKTQLSASYTLSSPLDLGFLVVNALDFNRDPRTGKITLSIDGASPLGSDPAWAPLFSPAGQDVTDLPPVPGRGNALFDLRLLALGQHVAINGASLDSVQAVIQAMEALPSTVSGRGGNPVNPGSIVPGQPRYDAESNWLVAADFGLLGVKKESGYLYTLDAAVVFNDPNLYGLRLAFNGDKAKVLAGLVLDILYKKVTDTVGVYQIDFTLPGALRQLNFGAVQVTLPSIGIEIYTNGDFLIDLGFPYNMDFSRSFTVQAFVGPVPVMGSGGFYFGKLSNATATTLPRTTRGTFDPVIEFGLGLQMGIGYSINAGLLSAGFSVTFFGIIQGVIAPWHPYSGTTGSTDVQSDNYFWLQGQFGIQGQLYGTVDFGIISASVSVAVRVNVQVIYEAYRAINLAIQAAVTATASVKIDLGLFSIRISFSFHTSISEDMTIGHDQLAPWDDAAQLSVVAAGASIRPMAAPVSRLPAPISRLRPRVRRRSGAVLRLRGQGPAPLLDFAARPMALAGARSAAADKPTLTIVLTPQYTVLSPDATRMTLADQQGAFVALFAMDSPSADGSAKAAGSSFASLCAGVLPWVIAGHPDTGAADPSAPVTAETLREVLDALSDPASQPAIPAAAILAFLAAFFTVDLVTTPSSGQQAALQAGAVLFPAMPGLTLTVPDPSDAARTVTVDFAGWTQVTPSYRAAVFAAFEAVAATLNGATGQTSSAAALRAAGDVPESLAQILFEDCFGLIARQLVQAALDAYDAYPYAVTPDDSLTSIMAFAQAGAAANPAFTFADLVDANDGIALAPGKTLVLDGIGYTVQTNDTLAAIAGRYGIDPGGLVRRNATATNLLQSGVTVTVSGASGSTVTQAGQSFADVAAALTVSVDQLAADDGLHGMAGLLRAAAPLAVPPVGVATAADGTDTLSGLFSRYDADSAGFVSVPANLAVTGLFDTAGDPQVRLCHLDQLTVAQLLQAVACGDTVGQTAGMVSRFMVQGLRLPSGDGLTLAPGFLYPATGQPDYGLYQLTGQQFPVTRYTGGLTVALARDLASLGWVAINGDTANASGSLDLTAAAANLASVLQWAQANGYDPSAAGVSPPLTLSRQPAVETVPQQFAASAFAAWSTSGMAEIARITTPGVQPSDGGTGQVQPILWQLPSSLLSLIETQQGALERDMSLDAAIPYLPVLGVSTLTTDLVDRTAVTEPVQDYAFATRIDFQIRQLAQASGSATQTATSNTLLHPDQNEAPPVTALAPNCYQLIGPNPADAQLLQRILVLMGSVGSDVVTGLLLAYADPGSGRTGLVGHEADDVYSFITRSNLSTQANPPAAGRTLSALAGAAEQAVLVNDVVNEPEDFLRLLWELSAVQSGGYTFYWDGLVQGAGLPSGLFDGSGYATLTLVVTYARSPDLVPGSRVTDCVNAVLTNAAIDTSRSSVVLVSRPAPNTASLLAGDTLATAAARYGMTAASLAAANAETALTAGLPVTLAGIWHQVTPQDMLAADLWGTLAAYYSANAGTAITGAQLQAYNPGLAPVLGTVILIPAVTYVTAAADTLGSIARYHGLPVEEVGAAASALPGLFHTAAILSVNPQSVSVVQTLGTGNLGIALTRANLGNPGAPASAGFAQQTLFDLYTMLDMAFAPSAFFRATTPCSPFGGSGDTAATALAGQPGSARALRQQRRGPAHRRAMLAAGAASPGTTYTQALRLYGAAASNAAPPSPGADLPPAGANPYLGVGTIAQLRLRWLDIFGNVTVTPFDAPPANYAGPLNDLPVPVTCTDRLIGLSQWPNVACSYLYAGAAGAPTLQVTFTLNTSAYAPAGTTPSQAAVTDARLFNTLYFQLNQNYDGLGIPGLSGPAVTLALANSLTGGAPVPLGAADGASLVGFVNACTALVNAAARGAAPPADAPTVTLSLPVDPAALVPDGAVRLRLWLVLSRQRQLVDPALLDVSGGVSVTTEIPAFADTGGESTDSLRTFAAGAEAGFTTATWQYRIGTGPADPDEATADQTYTVWAVRFARDGSSDGLSFTLGGQPVFFAPEPVANALYTGVAAIPAYTSGVGLSDQPGPQSTFTGVDLNLWLAQALAAIDAFLSSTYAAPAFILDERQGFDPERSGSLWSILQAKTALAGTISGTVQPIFADDAPADRVTAAAREALEQSLLQRLSNATLVSSVAVVPVTNASTNEALAPGLAQPPAFHGQPVNSTAPMGEPPNYALSTGSVPLNPAGAADTGSTLAFLFTCANQAQQASVPLTLTYQVTHLQNDITAVPGIDGYRQSSWIQFVNGPFAYAVGSGAIPFPVPLRALPPPPTALAQAGAASDHPNPAPDQLAEWDYGFTYAASRAAQDSLQATVAFNADAVSRPGADDAATGLFQALAAIIGDAPAIFADFDAALRQVDPRTDVNSSVFKTAAGALQAWATLVGDLAAAHDRWANSDAAALARSAVSGPPPVILELNVELGQDEDQNAVSLVTALPGSATAPVPVIRIAPDLYTAELVDPPPPGVLAAYRYRAAATAGQGKVAYLSYAAARAIPDQTVAFQRLNGLSLQSADTAIEIQRNLDLVEGRTTNSAFVFNSTPVAFSTPMVPLIETASYDLTTLDPGPARPAGVGAWLTALFSQMMGSDGARYVTVQVQASASYPLNGTPGCPRITLPISLAPPAAPGDALIPALSASVEGWLVANRAGLSGKNALLHFQMLFYGMLPQATLPLIKIDDVFVPLDDVA